MKGRFNFVSERKRPEKWSSMTSPIVDGAVSKKRDGQGEVVGQGRGGIAL